MAAVTELAVDVGTSAACHTLLVPRASYYRARRAASFPVVRVLRPSPLRALQPAERETVLAHLHAERFQDRSPAAVYATLLDEREYHCSIRTMYRLLEQRGESREAVISCFIRLTKANYWQRLQSPELDISKLLDQQNGLFLPVRTDVSAVTSLADGRVSRKRGVGQAIDRGESETTHPARQLTLPIVARR
jgi:hypothetical protein